MIEINPKAKQANPWEDQPFTNVEEILAAHAAGHRIGCFVLNSETDTWEHYDDLRPTIVYTAAVLQTNWIDHPKRKIYKHRSEMAFVYVSGSAAFSTMSNSMHPYILCAPTGAALKQKIADFQNHYHHVNLSSVGYRFIDSHGKHFQYD